MLVWYSGEDNPEITAALEEEKASSLCKKNSPRAKRGELFKQPNKKYGNRYVVIHLFTHFTNVITSLQRIAIERNVVFSQL